MKSIKLQNALLLLLLLIPLNSCGELILLSVEVPRQVLGINVSRIGIYDINSKKWTSFRTAVLGNEKIILINEREGIFQTLRCEYSVTKDECHSLKLKTITYDGRFIAETELPPLFQMRSTDDFAISWDGAYIVYYKYSTKSLHIYDTLTSQESLLLENVSSSGFPIAGIYWVSKTDLVLILYDDKEIGRSENTIIRINVTNKTAKTLCKPVYLSSERWAFSKNFIYLAYWDGNEKYSLYGNIKVVETETGRIVAIIPGNNELIWNLCWSPDGNRIGYSGGNNIRIFSIDSNQCQLVKTFDYNNLCYFLSFLDENTLLYKRGERYPSKSRELNIIDLVTRTERKIKSADLGRVYIVDDGKKIIAEMGH